jgi:Fe-S cluster assembly iron-binding protein IscA
VLTVTDEAAEAVKKMVERAEVAETGGLRIYSTPVTDSEATIRLTVVPEPEDGDRVIETGGSRIFLEEKAAAFLDDKVLNATFEDQSIAFAIETLPETGA